MLSEILIGVGCFLLGGITGSMWITHVIIKVNKLYKADTGNDFVSWVLDKHNDLKKAKVSGEDPILKITIKNED